MPSKWIPVVPVPADAIQNRPAAHLVRGKPRAVFDFYDERGLVGYLYRFTGSDGQARDLPLTYCTDEAGRLEWRWQSFDKPRPLFGASRLTLAKPETIVVVTDDPECVEPGYKHLPGYAFVAYLGGLNGIKKSSWKPLSDRRVLIWPSADAQLRPGTDQPLPRAEQPLMRAAKQISTILVRAGCEVKVIEPPEAGSQPAGWNLAAAIADGWSAADTIAWMEERCRTVFSRTSFGFKPAHPPTPARASQDHDWRRHATMILRHGELADCRENVIEVLSKHPEWNGVLAWDEFAYRIVKRKPPPYGGQTGEWTEHDHVALGRWLAHQEGLMIRSIDTLARAVTFVSEGSPVHPVREYLQSLQWDGTERTHMWMQDMLGVEDSEYARLAGPMMLMNMVARVMAPGCIMRVVPVLVGKQLKGKSTALQVLASDAWFADSMFVVGDKDGYQNLRGKWLYEISEFHSFGRAEATRVKAFVSSRKDTYRTSYGYSSRDWPRQVSFWATTNQYEIFRDPTGSTRFWPFVAGKAGEIRVDLVSALRDQLFAEAFVRYQRGDRRYPTPEQDAAHFAPVQESHEVPHPWHEAIREHCEKRYLSGGRRTTVNAVLEMLGIDLAKVSATTSETLTVVAILQRLGCEKRRDGNGSRSWYYAIPDTVVYPQSVFDGSTNKAADGDAPF